MSAVYSPSPATGQLSPHSSPSSNAGLSYRAERQARKPVPSPVSMIQNSMGTGMSANGVSRSSTEDALGARQVQDYGAALATPVLQYAIEPIATGGRSPYLSPERSGQFDQPFVLPAHSPNLHVRTPSQVDAVMRQNAEILHELDELRAERDQTQAACDAMLTELMTTQETLQGRETEIHALREQLSLHQHSFAQGANGLSREEEKELRELRLRCSRLQGECKRKDEQIRQAQVQPSLHQNMYETPTSIAQHSRALSDAQERLIDAESRAKNAALLHQAAQNQADTYAQQMHGWSIAYDELRASHNDLEQSHNKLKQSSAIEHTRSREDAELTAALDDAKKMRDFFQENSERVAKKNTEIMVEMRKLQDALHARTMELEQQKRMLDVLQTRAQT